MKEEVMREGEERGKENERRDEREEKDNEVVGENEN